MTVALSLLLALSSAVAAAGDTRVSIGSPASPFSANKQNEPALAVDAHNPSVLAAGANEEIDFEACNAGDPTTCPFTPGVGTSGIYFSFDSGASWTQPTYTGWSARNCVGPAACVPGVGPIGTLPRYLEAGLVSNGDPALTFGPRPSSNGTFSWSNGSRLYYANLVVNFGATKRDETFKGPVAVAVSRTDDVAAAAAGDNNAWTAPLIVSKQSSTTFSDKEQIWADNASSSPFFGNVYLCNPAFRSNSKGNALPTPLMVATSSDGGDTWKQQSVTPAEDNPFNQVHGFGASGCTIRTDSNGVVYLFANQFAVGFPGAGYHILIKSFDGGKSWTKARRLFHAFDTCNYFDAVLGRCTEDGVYNAFTTPFRNDTTSPRNLVGVVLHSNLSSGGAPAAWSEIHRGAGGDPRGTTQNGLTAEFLGDYVYAVATNTYGAAVWNDARNAADCPAIDAWRWSIRTGGSVPRPAPNTDCPATFGNSDIYGGTFADPTP